MRTPPYFRSQCGSRRRSASSARRRDIATGSRSRRVRAARHTGAGTGPPQGVTG
jgi:hypothetical protein